MKKFFILILFINFITGCSNSGSQGTENLPDSRSIEFVDITSSSNLLISYNDQIVGAPRGICAGTAVGDINGDDFNDLYIAGGPDGSDSRLFTNQGNGIFEDATAEYGLNLDFELRCSPHFADYDGDGFLDLIFTGLIESPTRIFKNINNNTFEEVTGVVLPTISKNTISSTFGDYDLDGDLDLFLTHWRGDQIRDSSLSLFENKDGIFEDVSTSSNITEFLKQGSEMLDFSFAAHFSDIDNDRWPDLLITSDFGNSWVFLNNGDSTFANITDRDVITDQNGMGSAVGDYDNDGDLDWFVSSIFNPENNKTGNRLYNNNGDGTFTNVTEDSGVREGSWGWGSCFADFNNDGHLDIFHVNGWGRSQFLTDLSRLFMSKGDGTFQEMSEELGIVDNESGRGVVCFDFDRDGDIDLFISNHGSNVKLYRNDSSNNNNFINVKLNGITPNTQAIGSRIYIDTAVSTQMREVNSGNNHVSQNPVEQHFGLGDIEQIDEIRVEWLDGEETVLMNIPGNQFIEINHPGLN